MSLVTLPNLGPDPFTVNASVLNGKVDPLATDYNGNIQNVNIASGAGITYSKLTLTDGILNADINSAAAIANSKLNLASIAQTVAFSGVALNLAKGADITSVGGAPDIGAASGNYLDITGTTTVTSLGTVASGTQRVVRFTGALTLTHNGTSLLLPGAANITTAANDTAGFVSLGSGNWKCLWYQRYNGTALTGATAATSLSGSIIQTQYAELTTPVDVTAVYTADDSTPLYSEGNALGNVSITPNNASNLIRVRASFWGSYSTSQKFAFWINDATGSDAALAVRADEGSNAAGADASYIIETVVSAGSTDARTYYLVAGVESGTWYLGRGSGNGTDLFGASSFGSITVEEIKA